MARIELKNVRKNWVGATAVERIDLSIEDGAFIAVLGPSGCGKTTTLLMLAGIYNPTTGDIAFDGARVNDVEAQLPACVPPAPAAKPPKEKGHGKKGKKGKK